MSKLGALSGLSELVRNSCLFVRKPPAVNHRLSAVLSALRFIVRASLGPAVFITHSHLFNDTTRGPIPLCDSSLQAMIFLRLYMILENFVLK